MTQNPPILRNSAFAVPFVLALAAFEGLDHVVAAAVSSAVVLLNVWVLSILGPAILEGIARGESPVLWVAALLAKFIVFFGIYALLLRYLPPLGLGYGVVPLLVGTLVTGIDLARRAKSVPPPGSAGANSGIGEA